MRWFFLLAPVLIAAGVSGHGMLMNPPQRSSMWRMGYDTPQNFNDMELFCGGYDVQYGKNGGKCGECGDPWQLQRPRPNELGGKYGLGIITANYTSGDTVTLSVQLTTNHWGYFEFRICPVGKNEMVDQDCLDKYLLPTIPSDIQGPTKEPPPDGYKWFIPTHDRGTFEVKTILPPGLRCERCVLQWRYITATRWGHCDDGNAAMGCGPQEIFQNCADVHIA
ncbi:uncharacterized protein LOC124167928 [Ischnura elegans]|uniref:uncharacterized protein LOC124167928 n=1 Tax=Ischnura elegans TaxID=197161 RepID=UPI001ED88673|nr:uncharacterized protein LOC124167928 [Ischnura elegans]